MLNRYYRLGHVEPVGAWDLVACYYCSLLLKVELSLTLAHETRRVFVQQQTT
jgi:hypothetical protein